MEASMIVLGVLVAATGVIFLVRWLGSKKKKSALPMKQTEVTIVMMDNRGLVQGMTRFLNKGEQILVHRQLLTSYGELRSEVERYLKSNKVGFGEVMCFAVVTENVDDASRVNYPHQLELHVVPMRVWLKNLGM